MSDSNTSKIQGEGFAATLLVCATLSDISMGGDGAGITASVIAGIAWMMCATIQTSE